MGLFKIKPMKLFFILLTLISMSVNAQNIALNKLTFTSSVESNALLGSLAVDGNLTTRWSSSWNDNQWIYVDLGTQYNLTGCKIIWESTLSYAKSYTIQISDDAITWKTIYTYSANTSLVNNLSLSGQGRYVKINCLTRSNYYGFSIYEFEVYGTLFNPCKTYQTTIDSLKTVLGVEKVKSLTFQNETKILNNQISYFSFKTDSLIKALDHCMHPPMDSTTIKEIINQPVKYFSFKDTAYNTDMYLEQNFYNCIPYYKYQYITRFPVQTPTGIKTKEIILTQVQ